ncbi:hypothetical protein BKM03_07805 [Pseudomonas avellanae]|uniref:Uncharacterized protein n=1 Tax=Pseudomonas avellanae TaxID=46257 RepID=A0AAD0GQP3_9PSED|nr:hypothetical protein BKM03_07805 [Pseudomonas avellanae]
MSEMGCEAAPNQAASVVSGTSRRLVLLSVPDSSRTSEASPGPHTQRASARRAWERTCPRWAAKRNQNRPPWLYLVHRGGWFLLPVPGSSRTSPLLRRTGYPGQAKRRPSRSHALGQRRAR